ncbi:hypothetical protein GCM10010121_057810 [Streptomyces brasiliensis]|uniref:Uncharacterized protein n=1 Tax=Streptomyces brasiliensis TaxID=1954 RepID=A0A917NXW0_9ACTN|nr:hypothetical protein GCM10010121_057810 [Streptomyces brasiliensis]
MSATRPAGARGCADVRLRRVGATSHDALVAQVAPTDRRYRIGIPASVRAITNRWISLVPSKIV